MHPLTRKLAALRRRAYLLLLGHALAWTVAIVLAVGMVLGLLDWIIHFQDRGLRIIASGVVLATLLIFSWRLIWRALRTRFSDLDLALRIERRFPKFRDQLASTVQFLRQRDDGPEAGSAAMRREVIHQAMVDIEHVDLDETIDLRPVLRGAIAMSIVLAVVAVLGVAAPGSLRTAGLRLLAPLGDTAWPKANHLAFVDPVHRLASGERFEVALADAEGAKLPNEVRIHYRFETSGDEPQERVELMRPGRGTLIAAIESVARPFQYRAEGGDDDSMPWQTLAVVEPPIPEQFELTLHYPAYTGWRPSSSEPHLRALVGTRVAIVGRANKPLSSAVLRFDNAPEIPLAITPDGYGFDMAADAKPGFVVEKADAFVLDLADREQFHGGRETRYAVHAIEDRTPTVSLEEPAADIYMTADAVVPAHVLAKDDLAIRSVELRWSRSDHSDQPDTVFPLYAGPPAIEPSDAADTAAPGHGEARNLEHRWNLAELQLKPGAKLSLFASATDYRGATAQSHPRRLSIITPDELQDRLTERQGAILNELGRMLKLERESRAQVSGVQIQLDHVGRLNKHDADQLQQAELTQRQVERGLGRRGEGIPAQLQGLLDELRNNRVANGEVENRLNQALEEIDRIGREHLPPIARELTSALKAAQEGQQPATEEKGDGVKPDTAKPQQQAGKPEARVGRSLAAAGQQQDATIGALEQLLQNLTEWDNYRRFHRDIGQLRREQDELARETATQGATTLTQELKDLKPQQLADLKKLGSRQMDLARNFEKVQDRMQQMAEQLRQSDPLTSETINDALHEARQKTLGGQMRSAGREIEQNQVGQAGAAQQQVMQGLDELLDILSNRRERELGRLVKKLRESEQQMQQLRQQQAGLRKKLEENARRDESPDQRRELQRLTQEQKRLQEELERFARSLRRLQADQASRTAGKAGGRMSQAGQQGEQGDAGGAAEQAAGAEKDLEDAQKQLAERRKKAEADLAQEQIARLEQTVGLLRQQQEKLLAETRHYDELAKQPGGLRRAQLLSLRDVARSQRAAADEADSVAKKLATGAFGLAMKSIARRMTSAAEGLDSRDAGEPTQRRQRQAIDELAQVLKAFEPGNKPPAKQQNNDGGGQGGGGQQGGGGNGAAELRLIKILQEGIKTRVEQLAEAVDTGQDLTPEQQQEYVELGEQQAALADLLLELSKPAPAESDDEELKKLLDPDAQREREEK